MNGDVCALAAKSLLFAVLVSVLVCGPVAAEPSGKLVVFHAGSLSVPIESMVKEFEARYPKVEVLREGGGSTKLARMIVDQGKPADIMASADYEVIDKLLIPKFADYNIRFATNQIVLCYTPKSKYASEISASNWTDVLQRPDVAWGHSDPDLDPCGYRSLMTIQLAEKFSGQAGLYDKILANRPGQNVRPKASELVAMLESGALDYAFEYMSVAVQHGLKFVSFDDHINLGNYAMDPFYKTAVVKVAGKEPGTFNEVRGGSITYGVTILRSAPNPEAAQAFLDFLLDAEGGLKILKEQGQPPLSPVNVAAAKMHDALPESLKKVVQVAK